MENVSENIEERNRAKGTKKIKKAVSFSISLIVL